MSSDIVPVGSDEGQIVARVQFQGEGEFRALTAYLFSGEKLIAQVGPKPAKFGKDSAYEAAGMLREVLKTTGTLNEVYEQVLNSLGVNIIISDLPIPNFH